MNSHTWATSEEAEAAAYFLGRLDAQRQTAIEEAYFTVNHQHDFMRCVEVELIEAYLDQALSADDREAFERRYLASPGNRRGVDLIRNLSARQSAPRGWGRWHWAGVAAGSATIILLAGWLAVRNHALQVENAALRSQPPIHVTQTAVAVPAPPPLVHILFPGSLRGNSQGGGVRPGPGDSVIRLTLVTEAAISPRVTVRAILNGSSGEHLATLPAVLDSEGVLRVDVPVLGLRPGDYSMYLQTPDGRSRAYSLKIGSESPTR